jgi:glycerate-2-kinase
LVTLTPKTILTHLQEGRDGKFPETLKTLPAEVSNVVLGNNSLALAAAQQKAESLGHRVLNLGSFLEGETSQAALVLAGLVRAICRDSTPCPAPVCLLSGGETTVTLSPEAGKGGRNLEMTLALAAKLGKEGLRRVVVLCAGSDGEDGPTDAAGAFADANTLDQADKLGLNPAAYLARHDAYSFFAATGDLFKTGLTGTNVMDVRILLIGL